MPAIFSNQQVQPIRQDPSPARLAAAEVFAARPRSFHLAGMLRTLRASGLGLYTFAPGSLPHRFLDAVAMELERAGLSFRDGIERAIRRSVTDAFAASGLLAPRRPESFAVGLARFRRASPAPAAETIPAGTLIAALDGRTAVTTEAASVALGATDAVVPARAELPGPGGNFRPGELRRALSSLPGAYAVANLAAFDGGLAEETDEAMNARFSRLVASLGNSNDAAVLAAAEGAVYQDGSTTYSVRDAAVVSPWKVPELNLPPGGFLVVVEAGSGTSPAGLVAAVQDRIDPKRASGNKGVAVASAALVVAPTVTYTYPPGADPALIDAALTSAWADLLVASLIEDGTGRGRVAVAGMAEALLLASPAVGSLSLSVTADIDPPVGSRAVAGTPTFVRTVS